MSYRRLRAVFIKELRHIVRDARSLGLALAMPAMMLLLYGFALSLDVDRIPILLYDQDGTAASRAWSAISRLALLRYRRRGRRLRRHSSAASIATQILMGIVIPRDFGKDLMAGRGSDVQLLVDGSDSNTASIALGYAESVVQGYSAQLRADMLNLRGGQPQAARRLGRMRVWYNSSLKSKNFVVPGLIAVILMIITAS